MWEIPFREASADTERINTILTEPKPEVQKPWFAQSQEKA